MKYELFYLVGVSKEAELEKIKTDLKNIVLEEGGVFEEKETEEKRKLSYEVKHETHGIYIAQRFELESTEKIQAILKKINLYQNILRFLVSKTDDLPEIKTKEERIKASSNVQKQTPAPIKERIAPRTIVHKKDDTKKESESDKETAKETERNIDKKLEEILNI